MTLIANEGQKELRGFTDLGSASNWMELCFNGSTTQIWVETRHQYGISVLRSFLRRHFAGKQGKPVVASRNVGCFIPTENINIFNIN